MAEKEYAAKQYTLAIPMYKAAIKEGGNERHISKACRLLLAGKKCGFGIVLL
jgi:hypothetical protein